MSASEESWAKWCATAYKIGWFEGVGANGGDVRDVPQSIENAARDFALTLVHPERRAAVDEAIRERDSAHG